MPRLARHHRDRMFELRPLDPKSGILCLCGFELSLGLRHGFVRVDACFVQSPRQIERPARKRPQCGIQPTAFNASCPVKLEVVCGEISLDSEAGIFEIRRACLRSVGGRPDGGIPDSAEQVRLPGRVKWQGIVGKCTRRGNCGACS